MLLPKKNPDASLQSTLKHPSMIYAHGQNKGDVKRLHLTRSSILWESSQFKKISSVEKQSENLAVSNYLKQIQVQVI